MFTKVFVLEINSNILLVFSIVNWSFEGTFFLIVNRIIGSLQLNVNYVDKITIIVAS